MPFYFNYPLLRTSAIYNNLCRSNYKNIPFTKRVNNTPAQDERPYFKYSTFLFAVPRPLFSAMI